VKMADMEVSEAVCYCNAVCMNEEAPFLKCQVCEKKFHIGELSSNSLFKHQANFM
jgi:hypothetical protein